MYAIVIKVVKPASISFLKVVLLDFSLNVLSKIEFMIIFLYYLDKQTININGKKTIDFLFGTPIACLILILTKFVQYKFCAKGKHNETISFFK
tara:strand:- start:860 stop:1138 length:279 start_codon:yes stop_codon:yes gene_type:complete